MQEGLDVQSRSDHRILRYLSYLAALALLATVGAARVVF